MVKKIRKTTSKKRKISLAFCIILFLLILATIWFFVPVTEHITLENAPDNSVRAVLITDLHSCYYGKEQKNLLERIEKENPDLILLGGDIFDDKKKDDNAMKTLESLSQKHKCYYVTGNHEYWSGRASEIKEKVRNLGITVLEGDCETIEIKGRMIDICGVDDPDSLVEGTYEDQLQKVWEATSEKHFKILISHRPEKTDLYEQYGYDLIVAGHAHAGQFRIPFTGRGYWAPDQGFMAKYVSGAYTLSNGSVMVVSRGLARESTPAPRFFNHPEIVVIDF